MSRIDDLIEKLAPDGVPQRTLGQVAGYSNTRVDARELGITNFVGVDNLLANKRGKINATYRPNTARLTAYQAGDVLLGNIRPYLKKVWLAEDWGGCSGDVLAIRLSSEFIESTLPKFLYHVLSSDRFFSFNMENAKGSKMPRGDKEAIMRYPVPLPPLEVQREIVDILDTFTGLEAGLEAELEAELDGRRRQYGHFRDLLLTPSDGVTAYPLNELCDVTRGRVISKDYLRDNPGAFAVYSSQTQDNGVFGYIDTYDYDSESITWTTDGANAGSVFFHKGEQFSITNVCGLLKVKTPDSVTTKYIYYQLMQRARAHVSEGMGNPKLMAKAMGAIPIPLPSVAEQGRIVAVLDKFDALMNDLEVGLPAELAARRKQYEYYRDQLLTFEELV